MRRILGLLLPLLFMTHSSHGQNLVINPSLENTDSLQCNDLSHHKKKSPAEGWSFSGKEAPDFFYSGNYSVMIPHSGKSMAGISLFRRRFGISRRKNAEYLSASLSEPLQAGQTYCLSVAVGLHRSCRYAVDHVGISVDQAGVNYKKRKQRRKIRPDFFLVNTQPLVNMRWRMYSGTFVASGGETQVLIGTFGKTKHYSLAARGIQRYGYDDLLAHSAYYMIDDLSVTPISSGTCGCNTVTADTSKPVHSTVFTIDVSASMKDGNVLDTMLSVMRQWIANLPEDDNVGLVTFSGDARIVFSGKRNELATDSLMNLIARIRPGGGTNINGGLGLAYDLAEHFQHRASDSTKVVLVSDGKFTISEPMFRRVERRYDLVSTRLSIIQVGQLSEQLSKSVSPAIDYQSVSRDRFYDSFTRLAGSKLTRMNACACIPPLPPVEEPAWIFFVDCSQSVRTSNSAIVRYLRMRLNSLSDSTQLYLFGFNDDSELIFDGDVSTYKSRSEEILKKITPSGGTVPGISIQHAINPIMEAAREHTFRLVILTDITEEDLRYQYTFQNTLLNFHLTNHLRVEYVQFTPFEKQAFEIHGYDPELKHFVTLPPDSASYERQTKINPCSYQAQTYYPSTSGLARKPFDQTIAARLLIVVVVALGVLVKVFLDSL